MAARRRSSGDVRLELGGALAPPLEPAHGVTRAEVERAQRPLARVLPELLGPEAPSGFLAVLRRSAVLREVTRAAARWRRRGVEDVVHVGIGGSALGAQTLFHALAHPWHDALPRRKRGGPRVHFVDNVDPETLGALFEVVDPARCLVHVVSKSGSTVETAAGFQVLRRALERGRRGGALRRRCVFTTGKGPLRELAEAEGVETLPFPEDVGGRFSVLTASGLFTPAVAGLDVAGAVRGARRMLRRLQDAPLPESPAAASAAAGFLLAERRGKPIHVLMPYADALEPLARWYVQLAGESLGKVRRRAGREEHKGFTPLAARGSTDQHSQVQLFVEGPADKLVTFVVVDRPRRELAIGGGPPAPYLDGVPLGELLRAEQRGTAVALARAGRPTTTWRLPAVSAPALGQLFVALEVQIAYQAALLAVNAYDQPGVEAGKVAAYALLGREGFESTREEIERSAPPRWDL